MIRCKEVVPNEHSIKRNRAATTTVKVPFDAQFRAEHTDTLSLTIAALVLLQLRILFIELV